jgi:hypothetical protein
MSERLEREPIDADLAAALRELARDRTEPSPDVEARVLAAFDRAREDRQRRSRGVQPVWIAIAASLVAAVGLALLALLPVRGSDRTRTQTAGPGNQQARGVTTASGFITLPDAIALPPLESGQLVRTDLPVSLLPSLGIAPPASDVNTVKADFLVGQDGFARAVRLISQP